MTISFAPLEIPKLPKGWLVRLRTAVAQGAVSATATEVARRGGVDLQNVLSKFVDPDGQFMLDPDDGNAPIGELFALGLRFPLLPYLMAFANSRAEIPRHLCLLGDQGMGKTSVLAVLALVNGLEPRRKTWPLKYLKLGRRVIDEISSIDEQRNTVLLLDSLDEEECSFEDSGHRLAELVGATDNFRKVIIAATPTCVPLVTDPRGGTAYVRLSNRNLPIVKIAPFDEREATNLLTHVSPLSDAQRDTILAEMTGLGSFAFRPLFLEDIRNILPLSREDSGEYCLLERLVNTRMRGACEDLGWTPSVAVPEMLDAMSSMAIASWPENDTPGKADIALKGIPDDALVKTGILRRDSGGLVFTHEAFRAFFIARGLIERLLAGRPLAPRHDLMVLLRSWSNRPEGAEGRHQLKWSQVRLKGAHFEDWDLSGANFQAADLSGVDFTRADLSGADFRNARLSEAIGIGADFGEAVCEAADFSGAALCESSFRDALLERASFAGAKLNGAVFSDVSLRHVDFSGADLHGVAFRDVQYDASTRWPDGFDPQRV